MSKTNNIGIRVNNSALIATLKSNGKDTSLESYNITNGIKQYFIEVEKQLDPESKFPINFDDVYPIICTSRGVAIDRLIDRFTEGVDYCFYQRGKQTTYENLSKKVWFDCFLSLECMEFFVARRIKAVFNIYCKVFQKGDITTAQKSAKLYKNKISKLEMELELAKKQFKQAQILSKQEIQTNSLTSNAKAIKRNRQSQSSKQTSKSKS